MDSQYPLFSTIVTLYTIIFIYFPTIAASPLIISTSVLLLFLLRLGAAQRISQKKNKKPESEILSLQISADFGDSTKCENDSVLDPDPDLDPIDSNVDSSNCEKDSVFEPDSEQRMFHADESRVDSSCEKDSVLEPESRLFHGDCFVEWNVRAPLEVIYEAYEGEEDGEYTEEKRDEELRVIEKYASLSMYYPETDTDSSSDGDSPVIGNWDSPENVCFQWDDEDREELIEIELDCKRNSEVEEENLIEIDLSPAYYPVR
ncbi:hypothetical protein MTR67_009519 [Solanum verrucosum]|uniref:Transmembrane protein n=1 Tax=Solanum verrucosum TaxID=315347 RepID=A0AAF0TEW5_SOLVR|nr:uncharacterized protein LOC125822322 [Solanum verrucosum]WMV16134.1 hypothetical protein MTR67_009519 [Solanum verrucosum]